jgi:hypothetical protein
VDAFGADIDAADLALGGGQRAIAREVRVAWLMASFSHLQHASLRSVDDFPETVAFVSQILRCFCFGVFLDVTVLDAVLAILELNDRLSRHGDDQQRKAGNKNP